MNRRLPVLCAFISILAVFACASSAPQCSRTSEPVLSPADSPTPSGLIAVTPCESKCNVVLEDRLNREEIRHNTALRVCGGSLACRRSENSLHSAIKAELYEEYQECVFLCNHK